MSTPLLDLSKLAAHALAFTQTAANLGFGTVGDIDRFLFQSYGKAIRKIPRPNRLRGAIFFLDAPGTASALACPDALKCVLLQVQNDVAVGFYQLPMDLAQNATIAHHTTGAERQLMASGAWPFGYAQRMSRVTNRCVVWGNGVGATVCLNGDIYLESPDVVEELPAGLPSSFQSLSWDDGKIIYEFAESELNDTTETGIWQIPDNFLLRPKPEKIMSIGFGRFLKLRMAGYRHHDDEPYVDNEGRADISLVLYNGTVLIVEVKWVGSALVATKQLESERAIKTALKNKSNGWTTQYDDSAFASGTRQLAKYFKTGKYARAYLAVFDCCKPHTKRTHEAIAVAAADVAPYNPASFRVYRACVDPRKASKSSKVKS